MKSINITAEQINAILPQTQCEECGFKGCKPYAEALAKQEATIDLCPPGGLTTLNNLADLLNVDASPYIAEVEQHYRKPSVALIDESLCIGCVKCINACPVDAIVGAAKFMHTVVEDLCTGCGLCVKPCPMDCIDMPTRPERNEQQSKQLALQWRAQYDFRTQRLHNEKQDKVARHEQAKLKQLTDDKAAKKAAIAAAIARVKAKKKQ
jgi:electron transport complex protein RnfB